MPDFTKLYEVLSWLVGPAGVAVWMLWYSNYIYSLRHPSAEQDPYSGTIAKWVRGLNDIQVMNLVTFGSFLIPSIAAGIVGTLPRETIELAQPYYGYIAVMFIAFLGQQGWHAARKASEKNTPVG